MLAAWATLFVAVPLLTSFWIGADFWIAYWWLATAKPFVGVPLILALLAFAPVWMLPCAAIRVNHDEADRMARIDADLLAKLPLADIKSVTFYKRDLLTTDLICCNVAVGDKVWTFHEELVGWGLLIDHLQRLPTFRSDWFDAVSQPPFATSETEAFSRQ